MRIFALILLALCPTPAVAQALSCAIPDRLPDPVMKRPPLSEVRNVPHDGYILALSWSPQFCKGKGRQGQHALQCDGRNQFGFILHGLWPDGPGRNDPAYCATPTPVPAPVVRANVCITPSVDLIQHEWAKHGTCMSPRAEDYFRKAAIMYRAVRYPDMNALSYGQPSGTDFASAFAKANPGMSPEMLTLQTNEGGWLKEVRICLNKSLQLRACPKGEGRVGMRRSLKIWRNKD
jgi:ribonuclease T2